MISLPSFLCPYLLAQNNAASTQVPKTEDQKGQFFSSLEVCQGAILEGRLSFTASEVRNKQGEGWVRDGVPQGMREKSVKSA